MSDLVTRLNTALEGRYHIERQLGEGGMATVYLADDLRHERKVALKVLKRELAAVVGAERFLAEIKTTANLQHPHILPLHDSGDADGFLFYVMPYVEGESLRERLDREHQLPVDEAVQIGTNVAEALDYAHSQGVIHRDIKPANILLQSGKPVISDFGIALAVGVAGGGRLTETGLSLGTPHYMSPEQATGDLSVGAATDLYALGCVLYEMLVGEPPYTGATPQVILGKIIAGEAVSATKHRRSVPPNVDAAIRKALEKLPADRFTRAADLAGALGDPRFRYGDEISLGPVARQTQWTSVAAASAASLAIVVALALGWALLRPAVPPVEAVRFTLRTPPDVRISSVRGLAVSPDGRTLIFADDVSGRLYQREVGRLGSTPVPGTANAWYPFFSPDGGWLAYFDQGDDALKKTRLDGSRAQIITPVPGVNRSADWGPGGTIVVSAPDMGGLVRVRDTGGEPEVVLSSEAILRWIDLLPDGQAVLGSRTTDGVPQVVAIRLETGEERVLFEGTTPRYVPGGYLVFWREDGLWAARFDPRQLTALSPPTPIVADVPGPWGNFGQFAVGGGVLFYEEGGGLSARTLALVDRQGREQALDMEPQLYSYPRFSPRRNQVAVAIAEASGLTGPSDLWVFDLDRGNTRSRITFGGDNRYYPTWTPDGERLTYANASTGDNTIYLAAADARGGVAALLDIEGRQFPTSWSPDGTVLALHARARETRRDLWTLPLGGEPEVLLATSFEEVYPTFSRDGRWLAYVSYETGQSEVYVQPYPGPGPKYTISTDGGTEPVWSPDGSELFYRSRTCRPAACGWSDPRLMVVAVETGGGVFRADTPRPLMDDGYLPDPLNVGSPNYDVSPDGQRFVMVRAAGPVTAGVILNFPDELSRALPAN